MSEQTLAGATSVGGSSMGVRILLIDDSPYDRDLANRALSGIATPPGPVELVSVGTWDDAVPHLESGGFDLLLLDYHLPTLNGLDVLRRLEKCVHPPVIMMTGQEDIATAVETLRAGAYDYVPKSVGLGPTLCLAVERVLERVRLERELAASRAQLAAYAAELEQRVAARTALIRAQAADIEDLYLKAEEAARVKTEIVSNVSHELRTPLNIILGYTELLDGRVTAEAGDAGAMLATVRDQAERLRSLIESLLALNRLNTGTEGIEMSRFSLTELVAELRTEAEMLNAAPGLALEWVVPPGPCEVESDRQKVRAIARHLVSNAIKFTPAGTVEVAMAPTADGGIVLTVRDPGIGLPPEVQSVIFDDFRQLDGSDSRRYGGMGLGLGIVKRYTALLQGTVRIDSTPAVGTTIVVNLPPLQAHGLLCPG